MNKKLIRLKLTYSNNAQIWLKLWIFYLDKTQKGLLSSYLKIYVNNTPNYHFQEEM